MDRIDAEGVHYMEATLFACPGCGRQLLSEKAQEHRDGSWTPLDEEDRLIAFPEGRDFSAFFAAPEKNGAQGKPG